MLNDIIKQLISQIAKFLSLFQLLVSGQHNRELLRRPFCLPSLFASLKPRKMMEERLRSQFLVVEVLLQNMLSLLVSELEDVLARKVDPSRRAVRSRQINFFCQFIDFCSHYYR